MHVPHEPAELFIPETVADKAMDPIVHQDRDDVKINPFMEDQVARRPREAVQLLHLVEHCHIQSRFIFMQLRDACAQRGGGVLCEFR